MPADPPRRLEVLVVDDIAHSRRELCALVVELGHRARGADSGAAALDEVRASPPDVVLLDLLMPDLDGFEVTRRIRALGHEHWLPVIVTSSLEGEAHFIHALEAGADDCLKRPVSAALLDAKLRHYGRVLALQTRLSQMAQRQREVLDNILDPVITLDAQGVVLDANRAAVATFGAGDGRLAGRSCVEALGVPAQDLVPGQDRELARADGTHFLADVGRSDWRDGDAPRQTLVLRDVSEARRIQRMQDEFLATVSHELRTPLTSIVGALGLLSAGAAGALPAPAQKLAAVAVRNGERLSRLIDDVLDLTKLEGDRLVLHLRPQAAGRLVDEALKANAGYAERAGGRLQQDVGADAADAEVRVDSDRFLQVMANLLSNAIKHSPAGAAVTVGLRRARAGVRLEVRDQGPGIPPAFRARLFEKFAQAEGGDRRVQGGTGLGLYITRMLVERMGGRIGADAPDAGGTVFWVEFPLVGVRPSPSAPWFLHVDADFENRRRVVAALAGLGEVESVSSLAHAAGLRDGSRPAAVVGNPQSQGNVPEFCAGLARLAAGAPVLLLGDSLDDDFAARLGLPWLRLSSATRDDLRDGLRRLIHPTERA